jgi:WD40 repeat protein
MRRLSTTFAILFLTTASVSFCHAQKKSSNDKEQVKIQLVARYYNNGFFDISSDGKRLLLFGPSTPIKEPKSQGLTEWKPRRSERFTRSLRVVEWETGRELGIVTESTRGTWQRPNDALFVEGSNQVCFKDKDIKLWDYITGRIDKCAGLPKPYHYIPESFYEERVSENRGKYNAKDSIEKGANLLVVKYRRGVVTLFDRDTGEKVGQAIHPWEKWWAEYPTAGVIYGIALTRDNKYLLTFYADDTFLWQIDA